MSFSHQSNRVIYGPCSHKTHRVVYGLAVEKEIQSLQEK